MKTRFRKVRIKKVSVHWNLSPEELQKSNYTIGNG